MIVNILGFLYVISNTSIKFANKNPDVYNPDVVMTQYNMGVLYRKLGRFEETEHAYGEALEVYRKLADKNPKAYLIKLTQTQDSLGVLYYDQQNYYKAEICFKEVLQFYERLAEKYPQVYLSEVIRTLSNFRNLYNAIKKRKEAKKMQKRIEELEKKKA